MKLLELLVEERLGSDWLTAWSSMKQLETGEVLITKGDVVVELGGADCIAIADDWQTAIVTKEQYDQACKLVDDGYTLWFGGECPVHPENLVDIVWVHNCAAGELNSIKAVDFPWNEPADLIAYNVVAVMPTVDNSINLYPPSTDFVEDAIQRCVDNITNCRCVPQPVYSAHYFLEKGVQHMKDRAAQRDSAEGERSMAACVNAFNAMFGTSLTETQGWQFMVLLKMALSRNKFNPDDYEDGAAYTCLAGEAHSHE